MTKEEAIAFGKRVIDLGFKDETAEFCEMAISALSADVRPNIHGHWIGHVEHCESIGAIPSGLGAYKWCSNCDCGIDVMEWHRNNYNFCPNCGAIMDGEPKVTAKVEIAGEPIPKTIADMRGE